MALKLNATLIFEDYQVEDNGIRLIFLCPDPGGGEQSYYEVFISDTDLASVTSGAEFKILVLARLKRLYRAEGIASKLDSYIGQSVTI